MSTITASLFMGAVLLTTSAVAELVKQDKNGHFGRGEPNPTKILRKLSLTKVQRNELNVIFDATVCSQEEGFQCEIVLKSRRTLIEAKIFDVAVARKLAERQAAIVVQHFVQMLEAEHKAWQVLTLAQQKKRKLC